MSKKQQKKTGTEDKVITRSEQIHGAVILGYAVLALLILEYFGRTDFFHSQFPALSRQHFGLYPQLWWAAWTIVLFLILPAFIVKAIFKKRLSDYGLNLKIKRQYYAIYLGMFLIVLPLVIYASTRADFSNYFCGCPGLFGLCWSPRPGFLGNLRNQLTSQTQKLACFELAKSMSRLSAKEIRKHLPERLPSL